MAVLGDVQVVIVGNEFKVLYLPLKYENHRGQKQSDQQFQIIRLDIEKLIHL